MAAELIDKLSKITGLRVPTSSFYLKGKQIPLTDIAKTLSAAYVLDGSVRHSGVRLWVAPRLISADDGYVVWYETCDRPFNNMLMVRDEVTKALRASVASQ